jgi:hypothetical protein
MSADPLLERILYCCRLSTSAGGAMPIVIIVRDNDEKARGEQLLRGRKGNGAISFKVQP